MAPTTNSSSGAASDAEQEVLDLYLAQNSAMVDADIGRLDGILDDDYVAIHIGGYRQPKREWLEQIRSGEMSYHAIHVKAARVTITADEAVLETRAVVDATIYGAHAAWPLQSRTTLSRRAGRWKATSSAATVY